MHFQNFNGSSLKTDQRNIEVLTSEASQMTERSEAASRRD
jgi:hypothetical protein